MNLAACRQKSVAICFNEQGDCGGHGKFVWSFLIAPPIVRQSRSCALHKTLPNDSMDPSQKWLQTLGRQANCAKHW